MKVGIITEDKSDAETIREVIRKVVPDNSFSLKPMFGFGCGKLRRKCGAWVADLARKGCVACIVVHDLDDWQESKLRDELGASLGEVEVATLILIPVRELEAWLLSDARALKTVFGMQKVPRIPAQPELIADAKEELGRIVSTNSSRRYLNTTHNAKIAAASAIDRLEARRCLAPLVPFIKEVLT